MKKNVILMIFLVHFVPLFVAGQSQTRDKAKEQIIEQQLFALNPLMVENFKSATVAMDQNEMNRADSLFSIVVASVPEFDAALRRLGGIRVQQGKVKEGLALCERALALRTSSENILTYANSLARANTSNEITAEQFERGLKLLNDGVATSGEYEKEYLILIGMIAMDINREADFEAATDKLAEKYPDEMLSHYYSAILAANNEDWSKSEREILKAGEMGLSDITVNEFLDSGVRSKAHAGHIKSFFIWLVVAWVAGLILLYLLGILLSKRTLQTIERQLKESGDTLSGKGLRRIYRSLINVAGIYYYISLPFILVLFIMIVGGIIYLFLSLGQIPIKLTLILVIGVVVSIYGLIRSLLVKVKYEDPGRELKEEEAPGIFALTKGVAEKMDTRPIDEIRITALTDLAVYEKGSWRMKMQDKSRRILILGTGIVNDFKVNDFKAVLSHEYGHFSNRDTAGGEVALRVRGDMHKYFLALYNAGQAVGWNLAFQFLRLYDKIFITISHGSTRLQEVLADRVAAKTYGAQAFKNGLTHVIRRSIEFNVAANAEIEDAGNNNRAINNLYELQANSIITVEEEFNNAMNRKTTNNDTHPGPSDRFRYVEGFISSQPEEGDVYVCDLFVNWDAITSEMTTDIQTRIKGS